MTAAEVSLVRVGLFEGLERELAHGAVVVEDRQAPHLVGGDDCGVLDGGLALGRRPRACRGVRGDRGVRCARATVIFGRRVRATQRASNTKPSQVASSRTAGQGPVGQVLEAAVLELGGAAEVAPGAKPLEHPVALGQGGGAVELDELTEGGPGLAGESEAGAELVEGLVG